MYFLLISPNGEQALFEALNKEEIFEVADIGTDVQIIELSYKVVKQIRDNTLPKVYHYDPDNDDLPF